MGRTAAPKPLPLLGTIMEHYHVRRRRSWQLAVTAAPDSDGGFFGRGDETIVAHHQELPRSRVVRPAVMPRMAATSTFAVRDGKVGFSHEGRLRRLPSSDGGRQSTASRILLKSISCRKCAEVEAV